MQHYISAPELNVIKKNSIFGQYFQVDVVKSLANEIPLAMAAAADAVSAAPKKAAPKKPKTKPTHPKTSDMVMEAIKASKDRKGSSLIAIKKSIAANNKVDVDKKLSLFIRKFLKKAVADGLIIQTKGTGASGSFKLPAAEKSKKPKTATPKKAKAPAKKAKATPKKPKAKAAKKATKSPKKPKAPKPKKAVSKPKAKKAAPKKK